MFNYNLFNTHISSNVDKIMAIKDFTIRYDESRDIVIRKIINAHVDLNDTTYFGDTTALMNELLTKHKCHRIFADFSLTGIQMNYEIEFFYAKNFKKIFDYPEGTFIAIYEGTFYDEKNWALIKHIFEENNVNYIEVFGDYSEAMAWLQSK